MINVSQSFHRTSANAIDETLTLTKAQMLTVNDNLMPNKYLTICQDDGAIYLYDKSAVPSVETGKFTKFEGGGGQGGSGITIDATLLANGWDNNTKQQTITFTGYETSMGGVIGVPASATAEQKEAYNTAKINIVSVSGTSFTFECEEIPSINLPVTLYAGGSGGGSGADLPSGGTTGQALIKASDADQDVEWGDVSGEQIQYDTMPQADITNLGQIVQYIGTTDTDYTNGLFYECVSDGQATPTYSWAEKLVQNTDVDLTNVFASGMPISTADKRPFAYSTEEQIVGSWIDGKPLYQKTIDCGALPNAGSKSIAHGISNLKRIINFYGYAYRQTDSTFIVLPHVQNNLSALVWLSGNMTNITIADERSENYSFIVKIFNGTSSKIVKKGRYYFFNKVGINDIIYHNIISSCIT